MYVLMANSTKQFTYSQGSKERRGEEGGEVHLIW